MPHLHSGPAIALRLLVFAGLALCGSAANSADNDSDRVDAVVAQQPSQNGTATSDVAIATPDETTLSGGPRTSDSPAVRLKEVVVTGERLPGGAGQSAQDAHIDDRERIGRSGQITVSDFLATFPEVSLNSVTFTFPATSVSLLCAAHANVADADGDLANAVVEPSIAESAPVKLPVIMVTAERLEADVQSIPAAVVVLPGQSLRDEGRIFVRQMLEDVPNVTYGLLAPQLSPDNPNQNISIRGVMAAQQTGGLAGPAVVATYVDDVFQGIGADYDLNRVEILYGPQGTLYGRSATAGVVAFHTNDPVLKLFGAELYAEYGTADLRNATAVANVPVGDSLAFRVAVHANERQGFWWNVGGGTANNYEGRLKVLYQPSSQLTVLLSAAYQTLQTYSGGPNQVLSAPDTINYTVPGVAVRRAADGNYAQFMGTINYDFGGANLTYVGSEHSYQSNGFSNIVGPPFMPIDNYVQYEPDRFNMHELRLASNSGGPLTWLFGANFYSNNYQRSSSSIVESATQCGPCGIPDTTPGVAGGEIFSSGRSGSVKDYAAFTEETYEVRPDLQVTAGLRFDHNVVEQTTSYNFNVNLDPHGQSLGTCTNLIAYGGAMPLPCVPSSFLTKVTFDNFTYKLRAAYEPGPSNMIYAMVSTGYLPGDVQISPQPHADGTVSYLKLPYQQERLTSYEIGSKNQLLGNRLQLNGTLFYYDYDGWQQAAQLGNTVGGAPIFTVVSVPLRVVGGELEADWLPTPQDRFTLWAGLHDAEIRSWPNVPGTATSEQSYIWIKRLPGTPLAEASVNYEHAFRFDDGSSLTPWAQARYEGGHNLIELTAAQYAQLSAFDWQASYALLNAGAIWVSPRGTFRLTAYVRNLLNKEIKSQISLNQNTFSVIPGEPRVFGVSASAQF